ncbi:hypothetical protein ABG808_04315 [Streptococcus iniae]
MKQTVAEEQSLHFQNVISTFYETTLNDMSIHFETFLNNIFDAGYTANGPFFYCINSDMSENGKILIQTFYRFLNNTNLLFQKISLIKITFKF